MTAHSDVGASGAYRWMNCPGSVAACAAAPPAPESEYAKEGTTAHALAAACLENGLYNAVDALDCVPGATPEMAKAVNVYLDSVWSLVQAPGREYHVERRFTLTTAEGAFGTCDCCVLDPAARKLWVIDYKHGAGVTVDVEGNPQLLYYGLGAVQSFAPDFKPREIELVIVQPRAPGVPIKRETIDRVALAEFELELADAIERTRQPNAPLKAGDWCRWCSAAPTCKAFEAAALSAAQDGFGNLVDPFTVGNGMSPAELGERLRKIPLLKEWIRTVETNALCEARLGHMPAGFKWVKGRDGNRQFSCTTDVVRARLLDNFSGVRAVETVPRTPAAIEADIGNAEFKKLFGDVVTRAAGRPVLAPIEDKREAVTLAETEGF